MSGSNTTKKAMADAMKRLMMSTPFTKISVGQICDECHMNRKSFYYHFKDKQDLVNWIFQSEFISAVQEHSYESGWDFLSDICDYFYQNRAFYRKALKIEGQNSFSDYFREMLEPAIRAYVSERVESGESTDFFVLFLSDTIICAIKRWLMERNCMPAEKFVGLLRSCLAGIAQTAAKQEEK